MAKFKNNVDPPARTPAQRAFHEAVRKNFWRNAIILVLFEASWFVGMAFLVYMVFAPVYLNTLKAPKVVIGIVSAGFLITVPMNFLADRVLRRGKRNLWVAKLHMLSGIIILTTGILSILFSHLGAIFLMVLYSVGAFSFCATINLAAPIYWEVLTDNVPLRLRGRFFAARIGIGGLVGFAMVQPARWMSSHFEGLRAFHMTMIFGGIAYALASLVPLFVRDTEDPSRMRRIMRSYKLKFRHEIYLLILKLWFRPSYRVFIFFGSMLLGSAILGSFLVTYAQDMFGAGGEGFEAQLKMVYLGVLVLGGFAIGYLADRWGFRNALILLAVFSAVGYLTALLAGGLAALFVAYGLYACVIVFSGSMMTNLSLELMPKVRVRQLAAAMNLFCMPVNIFLPLICGWVLDVNKSASDVGEGYRAVFTVAVMLSVIAGVGFFLLVQEPRQGKVLTYRVIRRT